VISVEAKPLHVAVRCRNTEKGSKLKDKCSKGCIGCTKCVKACPVEAITMDENLAVIDHGKCDGCKKCVEVCVKKCIA
jgi:electron transport complex protein RnfB